MQQLDMKVDKPGRWQGERQTTVQQVGWWILLHDSTY